MFKHKKFFILTLGVTVCALFSCQKAEDTYTVVLGKGPIYETTSAWKNTYESGEELSLDGLIVKFGEKVLSHTANKDEITNPNYYFICTSNSVPTMSINTNLTINSNAEDSDLSFYVAHIDEDLGPNKDTKVYVSEKITVHVHNGGALKPWVWFVVTGVVIFGVIGMVVFTKRYKAKKEGNL